MNSSELHPHLLALLHSYRRWTGTRLLSVSILPEKMLREVFEAPLVIVSHGTEADPILNYGNRLALELWEMKLGGGRYAGQAAAFSKWSFL